MISVQAGVQDQQMLPGQFQAQQMEMYAQRPPANQVLPLALPMSGLRMLFCISRIWLYISILHC